LSSEERAPDARRFVRTTRLEAFSDGVFAIAITLLVLDLAIPADGSPWERVAKGWPFYLAYVVSFLTIGAAWLGHTAITDRLDKADLVLLRINLLLLLVVAVLPFPTRLVAESLDDLEGERVFVALYGLVLLGIRLLLSALDAYARRERLYADGIDESTTGRRSAWPSWSATAPPSSSASYSCSRGRPVLRHRRCSRRTCRRSETPRLTSPVAAEQRWR
jgi:uncharacterized membrane protein